MNTLGNSTKTNILKLGSHQVTQNFTQDGLSYTMTWSADTVTGNTTTGYIGATQITQVWATSHTAHLTAIGAKIAAVDEVLRVVVDAANDLITVYPKDQTSGLAITGWVQTGGASQATVAIAQVDNRIKVGMSVELMSTGKIKQVTAATADLTSIGIALSKFRMSSENDVAKEPEVVTVAVRGGIIMNAQAAVGPLLIGPVASAGYDHATGLPIVTSTGVTVTNQIGWAIDAGTNIGDEVRVIVKK